MQEDDRTLLSGTAAHAGTAALHAVAAWHAVVEPAAHKGLSVLARGVHPFPGDSHLVVTTQPL